MLWQLSAQAVCRHCAASSMRPALGPATSSSIVKRADLKRAFAVTWRRGPPVRRGCVRPDARRYRNLADVRFTATSCRHPPTPCRRAAPARRRAPRIARNSHDRILIPIKH
eukprot:6207125-Pleurochrysis_carterae.AAC.1